MNIEIRKIISAAVFAAVLIASAACTGGDSASTTTKATEAASTTTSAEMTTTEAATEETISTDEEDDWNNTSVTEETPADESLTIKKGVWWTREADGSDGSYYFFYETGGGSILGQSMGIGVPFEYEINGSEIMFHMAAADDNTPAKLTVIDEGTIRLEYTNSGSVVTLNYLTDDADNFTFHSNESISTAAAAYYTDHHDGAIPLDVVCYIEDDGRIRLTITGASEEVYYIDRFTGTGTDANGNDIDLGLASAGSLEDMMRTIVPEPWNAAVIQRQVLLDEECYLGVRYLGYIDPAANNPDIYGVYIRSILDNTGTTVDFPFTAELPTDRYVSTLSGQELYLVIPDLNAVSVKVYSYDPFAEENGAHDQALMYNSSDNAPFLLKCNVSEIYADVQVVVTDKDGKDTVWYPGLSGEDGHVLTGNSSNKKIYDFTDYQNLAGVELAPVG